MNVIPLPEIYSTAISASIEASQTILEVLGEEVVDLAEGKAPAYNKGSLFSPALIVKTKSTASA